MSGENAASVPEDTRQTPIREIRHKWTSGRAALKPLVFSSGHNGLPLSLSLWEYRRSPSELKGSFL